MIEILQSDWALSLFDTKWPQAQNEKIIDIYSDLEYYVMRKLNRLWDSTVPLDGLLSSIFSILREKDRDIVDI